MGNADQKRAILAVVISGVILFGWQYFFAPPVPVQTAPVVTTTETTNKPSTNSSAIENTNVNNNVVKKDVKIELQSFEIKNENFKYVVSNNLSVINANNINADKSFNQIFKGSSNNELLFIVDGVYKNILFSFEKVSDSEFKISNDKLNLNGSILINELGYLEYKLNSPNEFSYKFSLTETAEEHEGGKYKQFGYLSDDLTLTNVGDEDQGDRELKWIALDFEYHLFSIVIPKQPYIFKATEAGNFSIKTTTATNSLNFQKIFVKKEYDLLASLGNKLELSVDFGIWSIIAVPILRGLQFFYSIFPNWGISIIILTLLIRTLTFPLQYKSFKSMKKMQEIQPQLTAIRERLKDNPQKMQQETMALFKKAGTNPLGGCLPMILQMPIFFAFYRVLYSSVELVDAPFFLWIVDLSEKDPYYVLPVLMAVAMFFHQRLTPTTTMDATQKKIMMFMPLIFAVFMKDFPAGLTLYIFVSTVVAMLQQLFVFKRT